jgi:hypothetical protein
MELSCFSGCVVRISVAAWLCGPHSHMSFICSGLLIYNVSDLRDYHQVCHVSCFAVSVFCRTMHKLKSVKYNDLTNVRHEASRHFRNKKKEYPKKQNLRAYNER